MSEQTNIEWCDSTVNFWRGCTKVSPGCANCYAEALSERFGFGKYQRGIPRIKSKSAVMEALKLNRKSEICNQCGKGWSIAKLAGSLGYCPTCGGSSFHRRRIFSLSLGDWLDEEVPIEWLADMLDTIRQCDQCEWILCSKRVTETLWRGQIGHVSSLTGNAALTEWCLRWLGGNPPPNITLLASVENQQMADERIPELLRIPAARRGLSLEPLLGPVDLNEAKGYWGGIGIDWLIIGGESGPKARLCDTEWIRSLVAQGKAAGVPVFVKQLGASSGQTHSAPNGRGIPVIIRDKKGGDPAEWPEDLRVQQWPKGGRA